MLTLQRACVEEALEDRLSHDAGANDAERSSGVQERRCMCGHVIVDPIRSRRLAKREGGFVMTISGLVAGLRATCRKRAIPAR